MPIIRGVKKEDGIIHNLICIKPKFVNMLTKVN